MMGVFNAEDSVENLSISLVREYLSRKGFKHTLNLFDKESMKKDESIQNRRVLAEKLEIITLVKRNKERGQTFRCFLEMIVYFFKERKKTSNEKLKQSHSISSLHENDLIQQAERDHVFISPRINHSLDIGAFYDKSFSRDTGAKEFSSEVIQHKGKESKTFDQIAAVDSKTDVKISKQKKFIECLNTANLVHNTVEKGINSPVSSPTHSKIPRLKLDSSKRSCSMNDISKLSNGGIHGDLNGNIPLLGTSTPVHSARKKKGSFSFQSTKDSFRRTPPKSKILDISSPTTSGNSGKESFIQTLRKKKEQIHLDSGISLPSAIPSNKETKLIQAENVSPTNKQVGHIVNETLEIPTSDNVKESNNKGVLLFDDLGEESVGLSNTDDSKLLSNDMFSKLNGHCKPSFTTNINTTSGSSLYIKSEPITLNIAFPLRNLLFGSASSIFNEEWKTQGFEFSNHLELKYGLVQKKGGPCGLLACVQAFILKHLLFAANGSTIVHIPQPTEKQQKDALVFALTEILWGCRADNNVIISIPTMSMKFSPTGKFKADKLTEKLQLFHLDSEENLKVFIMKNVSYFTKQNGCILFLYSVILTRGVENIISNLDEATSTIIGRHGYCTQEMVNLLLTGCAVSNVFDGTMEIDQTRLRGINQHCKIGFLSLFEHYDSCQVGNYYKSPEYPIWVICSESHFSVLFSLIPVNKNDITCFDMYYYDGLARQNEEIRLTVTLKSGRKVSSSARFDLTPPLDHCIRTKWKNAVISWNETEPLL